MGPSEDAPEVRRTKVSLRLRSRGVEPDCEKRRPSACDVGGSGLEGFDDERPPLANIAFSSVDFSTEDVRTAMQPTTQSGRRRKTDALSAKKGD
jgi:hypothetical protein